MKFSYYFFKSQLTETTLASKLHIKSRLQKKVKTVIGLLNINIFN